jgi:hypothetical protein
MPSYAIKSSGIRQVAANTLIGNSTGLKGSAEELSATDAKTLLGLGTTDSPTFASATIGNMTLSDAGSYDSITSGDARLALRAQDGSMELYMHNKSDGNDSFRFNTANGIFELFSDADNQIDLRNGTSASNYERSVFKYVSGDLWIDTEYAGTGSPNRNIYIGKNGSAEFLFGNGKNTTYQNFVPSATGSWRVGGTSERFFAGYWGGNTVTTSTPMLDLSQTWNDGAIEFTGILSNITNAASASTSKLIDLQVGGTSKFKVDNAGSAYVGYGTKVASSNSGRIDFSASGVALFGLSNGGATLPTNGYFAFGSNYLNPSRARIYSDADNQIDIRYSTNAQTLNIYNTGSGSDYERGTLGWDSNVFTIGTEAAGTGLDRDLELSPATGNVLVPATGKIAISTRLTLNGSSRRLMTDNSQTLQLQGSSFTTSQTVSAVDIGGNFTDADGDQKVLSLTPTYNQSGTAGGTDILVNRMEQAVGSGEQNLMDLQVGGT